MVNKLHKYCCTATHTIKLMLFSWKQNKVSLGVGSEDAWCLQYDVYTFSLCIKWTAVHPHVGVFMEKMDKKLFAKEKKKLSKNTQVSAGSNINHHHYYPEYTFLSLWWHPPELRSFNFWNRTKTSVPNSNSNSYTSNCPSTHTLLYHKMTLRQVM